MNGGDFPEDSNRRKVVLVLSEYDISRSEYEPNAARGLNAEGTHVLSYPLDEAGSFSAPLQAIIDAGLASSGRLLIQNPYKRDRYSDALEAQEKFAIEKHIIFMRLCQMLGAKTVSVKQIDIASEFGKTSFGIEGGKPKVVGGGISAEKSNAEKLCSQMSLDSSFSGEDADIEEAERLLQRTGLYLDPIMEGLLDMRRYRANNLKSQDYEINLSQESSLNLKIAGKLNIPSYINFSAEYKNALSNKREFTLIYAVNF
jgi:hypothetical protein